MWALNEVVRTGYCGPPSVHCASSMLLIKYVAKTWESKQINLISLRPTPVVLWTDASWEPMSEFGGSESMELGFAGLGFAGAGESLSVSQSSSSSSLLLSAAIPGARKFCSQCGHLTRFPAALSVIDTEPLHRGHWSDFGTAIPGRHVRIVTGKD